MRRSVCASLTEVQKLIVKYGTAAHLAITAVAPLFLLPFCSESVIATSLLWLTAFAFVWLAVEPSCMRGESMSQARARVRSALRHDPLLWFGLLVVALFGLRALNGGFGVGYDAESCVWSVKKSFVDFVPGCVTGKGYLPFVTSLSALVVVLGAAHALGRSARIAFLLTGSFLAGIGAITAYLSSLCGNESVGSLIACGMDRPYYAGVGYGVWYLAALVGMFEAVEKRWTRAEPAFALALIGCALGTVLFSPVAELTVFAAAALVIALAAIFMEHGEIRQASAMRCFLMIVLSLMVPAAVTVVSEANTPVAARAEAILALKPFPEGFEALRNTLSAISLKVWRSAPWIGTGLGSFPIELRFAAVDADWSVVPSWQAAAVCGWWQLMVESGTVGALVYLVAAVLTSLPWIVKGVRTRMCFSWRPVHVAGFMAVAAVVTVTFVDASLLRSEVVLALFPLMAISAGAMPATRQEND